MSYSDDRYGRHSVDLLDMLSTRLTELRSKADAARDDYRQQLNLAKSSGFMSDYTDVLGGEKFNTFSQHIDGLLQLVDRSKSEITQHKQIIEQLAADAQRRGQ